MFSGRVSKRIGEGSQLVRSGYVGVNKVVSGPLRRAASLAPTAVCGGTPAVPAPREPVAPRLARVSRALT